MDERVAAAKRAARAALSDACERSVLRSEMSSLECYTEAWARYALTLEQQLEPPPPSAAPSAGSGQRPHPLPSASSCPLHPAEARTASKVCCDVGALLQDSLRTTDGWQWHEERAGAIMEVPLSWLTQIEAGVLLLRAAAQRQPALQMELAEQVCRLPRSRHTPALRSDACCWR